MMKKNNAENGLHSIIFQDANDNIDWNGMKHPLMNNDISIINDYLYNFVNGDLTFIRTIDFSNIDSLWQYYFNNYNIISNFAQIKDMTDDNVIFNSYMHNRDLTISNNINFDLSFKEILDWHIKTNQLYINAEYLEKEFYQYIEYKGSIIYIHESNSKKNFYFDFSILNRYQSENNQYWYYNNGTQTYVFTKDPSDDHDYKINYIGNETLHIDESTVNIFDKEQNQYFKIMYVENETLCIDDNCYFIWNDVGQYYYDIFKTKSIMLIICLNII